MAEDEKSETPASSAEEPPTVDESRSARYRREHGDFLANSLRPLPPLSPPPPPPTARGGWFTQTLWFLVIVYATFLLATRLIRFLAQLP